jgi:hypothetical protein
MSDKPFFVMLSTQDGGYTPMDCGENDFELAKFSTKEEAEKAAKNSTLGDWFGYEVFEIGSGF